LLLLDVASTQPQQFLVLNPQQQLVQKYLLQLLLVAGC
jgi:hypothetical protein